MLSKFHQKFRKPLGSYSDKISSLVRLAPLVGLRAVFPAPPKEIDTGSDVINAVNNVAGFLFQLFIALAVIFIIIAALFYLTAAGNQTQLDRAKNVLIYSIVAIVIALVAGGIVFFIGDVGNVRVPGR